MNAYIRDLTCDLLDRLKDSYTWSFKGEPPLSDIASILYVPGDTIGLLCNTRTSINCMIWHWNLHTGNASNSTPLASKRVLALLQILVNLPHWILYTQVSFGYRAECFCCCNHIHTGGRFKGLKQVKTTNRCKWIPFFFFHLLETACLKLHGLLFEIQETYSNAQSTANQCTAAGQIPQVLGLCSCKKDLAKHTRNLHDSSFCRTARTSL